MADDVTLLPCVVCGSPGEHQSHTYIVGPETTDYWVRCSKRGCPVETGTHESPADAAEAWNTMGAHSTIAALEAELAELKERRCETCKSWRGAIDADGWRTCKSLHTPMPPDARCDKWQGEET